VYHVRLLQPLDASSMLMMRSVPSICRETAFTNVVLPVGAAGYQNVHRQRATISEIAPLAPTNSSANHHIE
jgi:hypothetical protein